MSMTILLEMSYTMRKKEIVHYPTTDMIADVMTKLRTKLKLERVKRFLLRLKSLFFELCSHMNVNQ